MHCIDKYIFTTQLNHLASLAKWFSVFLVVGSNPVAAVKMFVKFLGEHPLWKVIFARLQANSFLEKHCRGAFRTQSNIYDRAFLRK